MSNGIKFHLGDNPHLIFDKDTGAYRDGEANVRIGSHVWVGEDVFFTKRAVIADECLVAARAVISRPFTETNCVIAGNPALVVKSGIQWYRNREQVPEESIYATAIRDYDQEVERRVQAIHRQSDN